MECAYCKEPYLEGHEWFECPGCKTLVCLQCGDSREQKEKAEIEKLKGDYLTRMEVLCPKCNMDMLFR